MFFSCFSLPPCQQKRKTWEKCKMVVARPMSKKKKKKEWVVCEVRDSTCALKKQQPPSLSASVHLLPSFAIQHLTIQKKHTNESLHKHVVQQISHVQQCSVQAQIMFVITVHQPPLPSPGNICWGKWDSWFPTQTHAHLNTDGYHLAQAMRMI